MKPISPVAIIGGGISGLGCARALRNAGIDVRLFESGSALGGRCATRLWQGHLVDYGVQYFTAESPLFKKELLTRLRQFRPIIAPIRNAADQLVPGTAGPRYYVLQGNSYLAHALSADLDIRLGTPVKRVNPCAEGLECMGEVYAAVVSSLPGPANAHLFNLPRPPAEYDPCAVALLEYPGAGLGGECYGREPQSPSSIFMSYCESHKAGRIVGKKSVFVVLATPEVSRNYANLPPEDLLDLLDRENRTLWQIDEAPSARLLHRWEYGWPVPASRHRVHLPPGAFVCGDSRQGTGVEEVWFSGHETADHVLSYLAEIS